MSDQPGISSGAPDAPIEERLAALIENISAYIEFYHGGSVTLVEFDGKVAHVQLGGACDGCPLSSMTLRGWVEGTVHQFFPDITVEAALEA
ncbi:NifU family protein [Chloroflexota bacterium]